MPKSVIANQRLGFTALALLALCLVVATVTSPVLGLLLAAVAGAASYNIRRNEKAKVQAALDQRRRDWGLLMDPAPLTYRISYLARDYPDGIVCCEANWDTDEDYFPLIRERTAAHVPVPSLRDALGQHITARVLRKAGYTSLPPYHPDRRNAGQGGQS